MFQLIVIACLYYIFYNKLLTKCTDAVINTYNKDIYRNKKHLQKFRGSMWRLIVYTFMSLYGLIILFDKEWILHPYSYSKGITKQHLPNTIRLYYYGEIVHYVYSLYLLFAEPMLKDFYQMLIHHLVALFLIVGSYYEDQFRFGTVVLILHDISDPLMEYAKICFYLKKQKHADIVFTLFASVFLILRCIFYPSIVILPALLTATKNHLFCLIHLIILCLFLLFVINFVWCYYILKMAHSFYNKGTIKDGDIRASEENLTKIK